MNRLVMTVSPFRRGLDWRFVDLFLPDAGGVHIRLMGQIHEVVYHQAKIAFNVIEAAAIGPFGAFRPMQVMDLARVGERWITVQTHMKP
jgi:hypothetical protein